MRLDFKWSDQFHIHYVMILGGCGGKSLLIARLRLIKAGTVNALLPSVSLWCEILTALHLQQGFSEDAAGHTDGLADVISRVFHLDISDGQLAAQWHWKTTWLSWLLGGEQQDLKGTNIPELHVASRNTSPDSCCVWAEWSWTLAHVFWNIHQPACNKCS